MSQVLLPMALLACPIGMGVMVFFMGRGMMSGRKNGAVASEVGGDLASLRAESAQLDARIADLESRGVAERVGR